MLQEESAVGERSIQEVREEDPVEDVHVSFRRDAVVGTDQRSEAVGSDDGEHVDGRVAARTELADVEGVVPRTAQ